MQIGHAVTRRRLYLARVQPNRRRWKKELQEDKKYGAYGGVAAAAVVDCSSGKKSRTANAVKIRGGPTNRTHCVHPANNTVAARATDAFSRELGGIVEFFKLYF